MLIKQLNSKRFRTSGIGSQRGWVLSAPGFSWGCNLAKMPIGCSLIWRVHGVGADGGKRSNLLQIHSCGCWQALIPCHSGLLHMLPHKTTADFTQKKWSKSEQIRVPRQEPQSFYNLLRKRCSSTFTVFSLEASHRVQLTLKGKGLQKGMTMRKWGLLRAILEAAYHS